MGRGFERELGGLCRNWCMLMLMLQTCLQGGGVYHHTVWRSACTVCLEGIDVVNATRTQTISNKLHTKQHVPPCYSSY